MSKHLAIYTAITGGYDDLRQPERVRTDADYICFSNDITDATVGVWAIRPIPFSRHDPILLSRFPKINPHLVLPDYDSSLYVDANVTLAHEVDEALDRVLSSNVSCAMVPHPERHGVFEEGLFLIRHSIGEPFRVYRQIREFVRNGFNDNAGLYVCSLVFRRHLNPQVISFSNAWWRGFLRGSKRDQLSVMPALAEAALRPETLVPSGYILAHTSSHRSRRKHSLAWHGIHYAIRKLLESRMRRLFRRNGIFIASP